MFISISELVMLAAFPAVEPHNVQLHSPKQVLCKSWKSLDLALERFAEIETQTFHHLPSKICEHLLHLLAVHVLIGISQSMEEIVFLFAVGSNPQRPSEIDQALDFPYFHEVLLRSAVCFHMYEWKAVVVGQHVMFECGAVF